MIRRAPRPTYHASVRSMLTDRVKETLGRLLPVMAKAAHRDYIPVERVEVMGFVDPEEDSEEIVVIQLVNTSPEKAMAYCDNLGATIESWTDNLPDRLAEIAQERISIEVQWTIDDDSL